MPKPLRSPAYRSWIRTLACAFCGAWSSECAHTGPHGLAQKASDFNAIPLCPVCHRLGRDAYHAGVRRFRRAFFGRHRSTVEDLIVRLLECYRVLGYEVVPDEAILYAAERALLAAEDVVEWESCQGSMTNS